MVKEIADDFLLKENERLKESNEKLVSRLMELVGAIENHIVRNELLDRYLGDIPSGHLKPNPLQVALDRVSHAHS
jgi:hypothetical protein